jgi:hypothetical protein
LDSRSKHAIAKRASAIKEHLCACLQDDELSILGNMQVEHTGTVCCPEYHIENIVLNFAFGYRIPVNVYVPENGVQQHPAIILSIGHWLGGKAIPANQIMCANFARNGLLVAAYDPICQGERRLYSDQVLRSLFGELPEDLMSVSMHTQVGNLAYQLGKNVAALFVKDSVSVLDYLCTRSDVDRENIGCTGQSGGGTQSLYLSAIDDRIRFVSPIQCLSKMRLVNPNGIGDCEQSLINISKENGFDYPDLVWASFPKPVLLNGALYDSFPIEGARETERELRLLYSAMGLSDHFTAAFAPCKHEISDQTRRFAYEWFVGKMLHRSALREANTPVFDSKIKCIRDTRGAGKPQTVYYQQLQLAKGSRTQDAEAVYQALRNYVFCSCAEEPAAVFCEDGTKKRFVIQANSKKETACVLQDLGGESLNIVIASSANDSFGDIEGSVLLIQPVGMDAVNKKKMAAYDSETAAFNAAVVSGTNIMAERVRHCLKAIDVAIEMTGCSELIINGNGAGAYLALLLAGLNKKISCARLYGLPASFETYYEKDHYCLPETLMIPGLLRIADIPTLLTLPAHVELL